MQLVTKIDRISLMTIGIFDPYLNDLGGGEKYMMTIAECLSQNHNVDVFWDNKSDVEEISKRFSLDLSKVKIKDNIFSSKTSIFKKFKETLKYDAIIFLSDGSLPLVFSKKLFIHFQQPLPNVKGSIKVKFKIRRVNAFFCNSEFTKSFIDKEFKINSQVIYPPVSIKAKNLKKENIILHVGRFRAMNVKNKDYKKQGVMVDAFKQMVGKGLKNWKLVIAVSINKDEVEEFENFKKKAQGFPIEFLINKNNDNLWEIYSKAKIYWHASGFGENLEENPQFAEHFGISTVEAMGAGVVPIVINAGGQREIVENNKNGFLWDDIFELKEKTLNLINDEQTLKKLSQNAMEITKKFNKENFCKDINKLFL